MKITKLGHSCILIEEKEARILIDPGVWSSGAVELANIDAVFITHEHLDHCHPETLKSLLQKNSGLIIYTNKGSGAKLDEAQIPYALFEDGSKIEIKGVEVEGFGKDHAIIYHTFPRFDNTGLLIAGRLYHPGDAVTVFPSRQVEILALPIVAPWARLADSLDYAQKINPKVCFPIHDGFMKFLGPYESVSSKVFEKTNIMFMQMEQGKVVEF